MGLFLLCYMRPEKNSMRENPKVSVIIPVYNVEKYLRKCLDSIINQTLKDIEIIIVNDCSTDNSLQIIEEYKQKDDRIVFVDLKQNKGVSNARNEGIKLSTGHYIAFIDADDFLEKNYIEKLSETEADISICSFYKEYFFKSEKNIVVNMKTSKTKDEFICDLLSFQKAAGCVWGKLFDAKFLKENNLFFDDNLKLAEDAEFCLRAVYYNPKIVYVPDILYHYNFSSVSNVRKFNEFYFDNYKNSLNKMEQIIDKTRYLTKWNNFVAHHLLLICINYCFNLHNEISYNKKREMLKEVLKDKLFINCLNLSDLRDFSLTKKITLFFLKHGIFFFVYIIAVIRNIIR